MAEKKGRHYGLYVSTDATGPDDYSTSTWTEVNKVADVDMGDSREMLDDDTRENTTDVKAYDYGDRDVSIDFEMKFDPEDAAYAALEDAYNNATYIGVLNLKGKNTEAGTKGFAGMFCVANFDDSQPLRDKGKVKVKLQPNSGFQAYTVGGA